MVGRIDWRLLRSLVRAAARARRPVRGRSCGILRPIISWKQVAGGKPPASGTFRLCLEVGRTVNPAPISREMSGLSGLRRIAFGATGRFAHEIGPQVSRALLISGLA